MSIGSPGLGPHINVHEKSAPQTNSNATSWHLQIQTDRLQATSLLIMDNGVPLDTWSAARRLTKVDSLWRP